MDLRHDANGPAQRAFRRMLDHYLKTGEWSPLLIADWRAAEDAADAIPEWLLDAQHDAVIAELDELADQEFGPLLVDVPLAAIPMDWTRIEDVPALAPYSSKIDEYQSRGA